MPYKSLEFIANYSLPSAALATWINWAKLGRSTFFRGNLTSFDMATIQAYAQVTLIHDSNLKAFYNLRWSHSVFDDPYNFRGRSDLD
jgi:hypothetical protein